MKKIKSVVICLMTIIALLCLSGCDEKPEVAKVSTLPQLSPISGNNLEISTDVENGMKLVATYNTGSYDLSNWKITDSKYVRISAVLENIPENAEVLVEHLHVDISLEADDPSLSGLSQDSMDNSYHGTSQDGFLITSNYPYECDFAIEGFSKDIIDGWGFAVGGYGSVNISSERLTEENLIQYGKVTGNKMQVVYSLIIKYDGEERYHKKEITQEFSIPIAIVTDSKK